MTEISSPTNIAAGLHSVPIDVPILHPTNSRVGNVGVIAESLQRFGQVRPIVVQRSTAYVIAGNHTLRAAKGLGWSHIATVVVDLDDEEAGAYLIADNRIPDLGHYDEKVLAPQLEKLMLEGKLEGTGYTPDTVDDMMSALDAVPEVDPGEFEGGHSITNDELADVFKNRNNRGSLRQFVLMYDQETAVEVDALNSKLERAWGVSGMRDVVLEALRVAGAAVVVPSTAAGPDPDAVDPDGGFDDGPGGQQTQYDPDPDVAA